MANHQPPPPPAEVIINNHTTVGAWSGGVELNGMWFRGSAMDFSATKSGALEGLYKSNKL